MSFDQTMALVSGLMNQATALAGLATHLRLQESPDAVDPALRLHLDRVVDALDARPLVEALSERERAVLVGFARSYLRQSLELLEEPARPGAWSYDDPAVLQAQGAASAVVASLIADAGFGHPEARILDVGTGVGRLAIAFCEKFDEATVVGLDPWGPALALARGNVTQAGLDDRITLVQAGIQDYRDDEGFDLVWLPSFFIPESVLDGALRKVGAMLRPGGTLVVGTSDATEDALTSAVDDLMTVRSGGTPLRAQDAVGRLRAAGFDAVDEVPRTWRAPIGLVAAGRIPAPNQGAAGDAFRELPAERRDAERAPKPVTTDTPWPRGLAAP